MTEARRASGLSTWLKAGAAQLWAPAGATVLALTALQPPAASGAASGLALLPLAACLRLGERAPAVIACPAAALFGASLDVLAQGPVGYWALICGAGAALGAQAREMDLENFWARWALFGVHVLGLALLQAVLTIACTFVVPGAEPIVRQSVVAALCYPLVAWMIPARASIPAVGARDRLRRR